MNLLLLSRRKIGEGCRELDKGHEAGREGRVNLGRAGSGCCSPRRGWWPNILGPKALQSWDQDGERHQ